MEGFRFYAEMPEHRTSKSACKRYGPFTRKTIREAALRGCYLNVCAVIPENRTEDGFEALAGVYAWPDSDVNLTGVTRRFLDERCVRIDEATARKLHPRLFERLDRDEGA